MAFGFINWFKTFVNDGYDDLFTTTTFSSNNNVTYTLSPLLSEKMEKYIEERNYWIRHKQLKKKMLGYWHVNDDWVI